MMEASLVPDLPRERLIAYGSERVTTVELLALILGTGMRGRSAVAVAQQTIHSVGGITRLSQAAPRELVTIPGIGAARAARIAAAFQLSRRAVEAALAPASPIASPGCIYERMRMRMAGLSQEVFVVLALNARQVITDEIEIARGCLTSVEVHPREVFRPLIRQAAAAAAVVHNHPSGDPEPSTADLMLTQRLVTVGEVVGIPIVDHVIIGNGCYVSLRERLCIP